MPIIARKASRFAIIYASTYAYMHALCPLTVILYGNTSPYIWLAIIIQNDTDCIQLQSDIDKLLEWSRIWQINFNVSKCYLMHLKNSHCYSQDNIAGNIISSTDVVIDLGIYMDKEQIKVSLSLYFYHCQRKLCTSSYTQIFWVHGNGMFI